MAIVLGNFLSLPTTEGPKATAPPAPGVLAFAGVGLLTGGVFGRAYKSVDPALQVWTEIQPAGNIDVNWTDIQANRIGNVGQYIFACGEISAGNRRFWVSNDYGATFVQKLDSVNLLNGTPRLTISPTGQFVYVYTNNGSRLNVSSDFGQSFIQINLGTNIRQMTVNDAGDRLIRSTFPSGTISISNNSGATFSSLSPFTQSVAFDLAGVNGEFFSLRFASSQNQFCKWLNYGASSTSYLIDANPVSYQYTLIKCNSIGQKVIAARGTIPSAGSPGKAFINYTGGGPTGWTELLPTGISVDLDFSCIAIEDAAARLALGTKTGLYVSLDNGATFIEAQPAGNVDRSWQTCNIYTL